jgi:hypothetical protein
MLVTSHLPLRIMRCIPAPFPPILVGSPHVPLYFHGHHPTPHPVPHTGAPRIAHHADTTMSPPPHGHAPTHKLDKRLDDMAATLARASSTASSRSLPTRPRTGRYQPYTAGSAAADTMSRPSDESARSARSVSGNRKSKVGTHSGTNDQSLTTGTDVRGLSACAICLSRNPHDVTQCDANLLWDGHSPAFARKGDKGAKLRAASSGDSLCLDWNLPRACNSNSHVARHRCSGCGNSDHGAQTCRLAQPKVQN